MTLCKLKTRWVIPLQLSYNIHQVATKAATTHDIGDDLVRLAQLATYPYIS